MREFKNLRAVNYKAKGDESRVRTGIAAVFGNIDDGGDITHPGAFAKTLSEGRQRTKHLWNHNAGIPPIAKILEIKEVSRAELPEEILKFAPEATGGLWVKREYLDTPTANEVLACIDKGIVDEMSYAYDVIKADDSTIDGRTVRNLRELALYDTSDVNYGMNPATLASGAKNLFGQPMPLGAIIQQLEFYNEQFKAGRRNNATDQTLINHLHEIATTLGCNNCKPEESPKSEQAEAAVKSTSLSSEWIELQLLELETLEI